MLLSLEKVPNCKPVIDFKAIPAGLLLLLAPCAGAQLEPSAPVQNTWLLCAPDPLAKLVTPNTGAPKNVPVQITSNTGESSESEAILRGDVQAQQGDQRLEASQVTYDRLNNYLKAEGDVTYGSPDLAVRSEHAEVNLDDQTGWFSAAQYYEPNRHAQGSAERVDVQYRDRTSQLRQVTYSTCERGDELWQLRARRLELNQKTGRGTAKHISLAVKNIPILYFPYLSFPINDERQSGFLTPNAGFDSENGFEARIPYYWNIAPNQDMTLTPRIFTARGLMLGAEYRFLTRQAQGRIAGEYLPYDAKEDRGRAALFTAGQANPWSRLYADLLYQTVSDNDYLDDFSNRLDLLNETVLDRHLDLFYQADRWIALARAQNFQTLDKDIFAEPADRPYDRLPQLLFDGAWPQQAFGLTYKLRNELVNFYHADNVHGWRLDLWPKLSLPLQQPAGYIKPQVSYRYTVYDLQDTLPDQEDRQPSRGVPIASLDTGLFFERPVQWPGDNGQSGLLTLEPRLFYLYVPFRNQTDFPLFDSTLIDPSYSWMFLENRFTGADRQGDANQLTTAVTSRLLTTADGSERARLSVGQIFYFTDRRVTLNNTAAEENNNSDLIGEGFVQLRRDLALFGTLQWDINHQDIQRSGADLRYRPSNGRLLNLAYRYSAKDPENRPDLDELEQIDISALWTFSERWRGVARWNYSLNDSRSLETFAGFEYDSCCWALRMLARQHRDKPEEDADNSVLVQLEFKSLAGIGTNITNFLEDAILGYESRY